MQQGQYTATTHHFEQLRADLRDDTKTHGMSKSYRKDVVLSFLNEHRLALPPSVLYRNLRLLENATFSQNTMENYLSQLESDGLVKRVDPKQLADRKVNTVDDGRGYYLITEAGVAAAPDELKLA